MKAIFHTGVPAAWENTLGDSSFCLAPVGGKPLIEYWLEWAADLGITDVRIVLGDGADRVETYCEDGSRWGLKVDYGFLRDPADPVAYLRRSPEQWLNGLLYICGPVFPRRLQLPPWPKPESRATYRLAADGGGTACLLSGNAEDIRAFLGGAVATTTRPWADVALAPLTLPDIRAYYDLNMSLVAGENRLYVSPGYSVQDGVYIGYNVLLPPAVELRPPFAIGNDCRIRPLAVIGPNAVIGNHVIIDQQAELADCVVLDGTYVGRNVEIKQKIVGGDRIISPDDGTVLEMADPWLLAPLGGRAWVGDTVRAVAGWLAAAGLTLLLALPFVLLFALLRLTGIGGYRGSERLGRGNRPLRLPVWAPAVPPSRLETLFVALSLDLLPLLALVVVGRLWLCGHTPLHPERDCAIRKRLHAYFPAAISYQTRRTVADDQATVAANALYYERYRSLTEDARMVCQTLIGRFLAALAQEPGNDA